MPNTLNDMKVKQVADYVKFLLLVGGICFSSIVTLLSFGSTWKNLPDRVLSVEGKIEKLNVERATDREILIRIDQRLMNFENNWRKSSNKGNYNNE